MMIKNALCILAVLVITPLDVICQQVSRADPGSEHPADIAARTLEPWETQLVEPGSWLDAIDWGDRPVIGSRDRREGEARYTLYGVDVGLEQWEDGERTSGRERWQLHCGRPVTARQPLDCSLYVDRFMLFPDVLGITRTDRYSTADRTLVTRRTSWENGLIDFTLVTPGVPMIEVSLQFAYDGDLMVLESFRARTVSTPLFPDAPVVALELRVPEYSYLLYMPFPIRGLKSGAQKNWNELIDTLSASDRQVWNGLVQRRREFAESLEGQDPEQQVRDLLEATLGRERAQQVDQPDAQATPDEEQRVQAAMDQMFLDRFREWLAEGGMSTGGLRRIMQYLDLAAQRGRENVR